MRCLYRDFCAGVPDAVERFQTAGEIFLPSVVLAELRAGFLCGTRARANDSVLTRLLNRPRVSVLCPTETTTRQ